MVALTFINVAFDQRILLATVAAHAVERFAFVLVRLFAIPACELIPDSSEPFVQLRGALGSFFQPALFMKKRLLTRELVSGCGHFGDDGITRDEVMLWETEIPGSFVGVEVDDGDARSWL